MSSELEEKGATGDKDISPKTLAKYFKYYRQFVNPKQYRTVGMDRVGYIEFYKDYKKYFDKLSEICSKYGVNAHNFIQFCINSKLVYNPNEILNVRYFKMYADDIVLKERYSAIYKHYVDSAKNVAIYCIENDTTPVEYMKSLILNNQLGYEYLSGKLSKHYIASIHNFDKLFFKLDRMNRDELSTIHDVASELNDEIQTVFLKFKNQRVSPMKLADAIITKIKVM